MNSFTNVSEVNGAKTCLDRAMAEILKLYPLTERNEWAGPVPPPEIVEALRLLSAAGGHLRNLCTHGAAGYKLVEDFAT